MIRKECVSRMCYVILRMRSYILGQDYTCIFGLDLNVESFFASEDNLWPRSPSKNSERSALQSFDIAKLSSELTF